MLNSQKNYICNEGQKIAFWSSLSYKLPLLPSTGKLGSSRVASKMLSGKGVIVCS